MVKCLKSSTETFDDLCIAMFDSNALKMDFERTAKLMQENIYKEPIGLYSFGTSFPNEPVCYLSLETVLNTFHSVLLVAEIAGALQYISVS